MTGPLLRMLVVVALSLPFAAVAQTDPDATDAGRDVNVPVPPGLDSRTPVDRQLTPEEVPLYVPHQDKLIGRVSIPDQKLATLVQPEGRTWREFRMEWLVWGAAIVMLGTLAVLAAFFLWRGRITLDRPRSGRWVPRFSGMDRFAHWTTALSFVTLAITGVLITFGRYLLIPLIGHPAFTVTAEVSKSLHNFSSVAFVIGIVMMLVLWVRDNIPDRSDLEWIRHGGGLFKRGSFHPESGRFNAGQKGMFWAVILGGIAMAVTGYMLMMPFTLTGIAGMQIVHVIHSVLAALMIALIFGHIYIGTIGMEGAFDAMGRGKVDETWAIEHHRGWYEAQRRQAAAPARSRRSGTARPARSG